jgi:putative iron-regulated protein
VKVKVKLMFKRTLRFGLPVCFAALAIGCGSDDTTPNPLDKASAAAKTYAQIVSASYEDSLASAEELDAAIADFIEAPSEGGFEDARQAWLDAREPYLQTEVYRFYNGPIDDEDTGPEGLINAWPLDENYIDYVRDPENPDVIDESTGIVNDTDFEISAESLLEANEGIDEKSISTGYHAIEFLLWGQDNLDVYVDGGGQRAYTDYVTGQGGTHQNQDRRGQYLTTASGLLLGHLRELVDAWKAGENDNYRAHFEAAAPKEQLSRILTGMIVLSEAETGGERLQPGLDLHDQEEEHSCFSDNTHRDFIQDLQGVLNVYRGTYRRTDGSLVEGPSVHEAVAALDAELADELDAKIEEGLDLAKALEAPFDREIAEDNEEGNARVQALIDSLKEQGDLLEEVFAAFELPPPSLEL